MSVFVGGISKCDPQLSNAEPVIVAGKPAPALEPRPDITQGSKLSALQFQSALCPCGRSPWPCLVWLYDAAPRPGF